MGYFDPRDIEIVTRPIHNWQGPARCRYETCRFKTTPTKTTYELQEELGRIGVGMAVLQIDITERDIRNDGKPRADCRPTSSRVALSFEHPQQGPITMPCYTYDGWHNNLRAIVKTLEALRAVDRHGAVTMGQQYAGFKALPVDADSFATIEEAAAHLLNLAVGKGEWALSDRAGVINDRDLFRKVYRDSCSFTHPDADGGSERSFTIVQKAANKIKEHNGWK